jgi:hypothetical protein
VAIAEKSFVKELAEICGTAAELLGAALLLPPLLGVEDPPLLPQAARMSAALPAIAVRPTLLGTEYNENHLACGRDIPEHARIAVPASAVTASRNLLA